MLNLTKINWTDELITAFWDGIGNTRLDELSFGRAAGPLFLDFIKPLLSKEKDILDFGAGSGHLIQLLCERGYRAAGFEISEDRKKNIIDRMQGTHNFIGVVDATSTQKFDVVIIAEVIEHVSEQGMDKFLLLATSFLKDGGTIIVTTPHKEDLELNESYCVLSNTFFHRWQHLRSFTPEAIEAALGSHGIQKQFLGVLDFSADAIQMESFKRMHNNLIHLRALAKSFLENLQVIKGTPNSIEKKLITFFEGLVKKIAPISINFELGATGLFVEEQLLFEVPSAKSWAERLSLLKEKVVEYAKVEQLYTEGPYDFSIGHENTIFYAGKKVK